jgi:phosphatidate cytidylyltransferase
VLRQRVITGLILAALFLLTVIVLPTVWIAVVFAAVAITGAWEWAGLAGITPQWQRCIYAMCLAPMLVVLWFLCDLGGLPSRSQVQPWLGVTCLFWSMTVLFIRSYPDGGDFWQAPVVRALMGLLILAATWLSVVFLKTLPGGAWLVILLIVGVAAADIGAYFFGRRFGRHKLAPAVSPGKTWEGMWGGVLAVVVVTIIAWQSLPPSLAHLRVSALIVLGLSLAAASVLGDLTISMVKRTSGVKDSSGLLPGHGGVLDRIDSICGAAPVFALGLILVDY